MTTPKRDLEDDALDEEEELIQSGRGAKDLEFDCRGVEHDTCKSRVEVEDSPSDGVPRSPGPASSSGWVRC